MCVFLLSGTLSDRSQGCIPKNLTMLPTASAGRSPGVINPLMPPPLGALTTPPAPNPTERSF